MYLFTHLFVYFYWQVFIAMNLRKSSISLAKINTVKKMMEIFASPKYYIQRFMNACAAARKAHGFCIVFMLCAI